MSIVREVGFDPSCIAGAGDCAILNCHHPRDGTSSCSRPTLAIRITLKELAKPVGSYEAWSVYGGKMHSPERR